MRYYVAKISLLLIALGSYGNGFASESCSRTDNDVKILSWAFEAMMETNNYNFTTHNQDKASIYFTKSAWTTFKKEFELQNRINKVINDKLVSTVGLQNSPLILQKSKTQWKVQMPLIINYRSAQKINVENKIINLDIAKDPKAVNDCLIIEAVKVIEMPSDACGH